MATHFFSRSLPRTLTTASRLSRSFSTAPSAASLSTASSPSRSLFHRLRPLAGAIASASRLSPAAVRSLSTNATTSSLRDPNPNWSNRPPKETILLDGCDFQHWLVVMEPPEGDLTRDEIIDGFIKTLAMVVGSEEEARMKIYSVSHKCYFAFGALVDEETSIKIKELPKVRWVLPDSYLDVRNKDYGGEPFINGEAVPYDPKYHEEWIRNNSRANERNRRNDRPRPFDRSRNFDRRRENMQNRDFQNRPPVQNAGPGNMAPPQPRNVGPPQPGNMGPPPPGNMGPPPGNMSPPRGNMGPPDSRNMPPQPNMGPGNNYNNVQPSNNWNGGQPNYNQGPPNGGQPSNNWNGGQPNYTQGPPNGVQPNYNQRPPNNYNQTPPQGNYNNISGPPNNMGVAPQDNMGGRQVNAEWGASGQYQNNYTPERDDGGIPGTNRY